VQGALVSFEEWRAQSASAPSSTRASRPDTLGTVHPLPLPRRPASRRQAEPWEDFDLFSTHPGDSATPQTVVSVFRQAEAGYLGRQADLFEDLIENDGHLRSLMESRIAAVAGKDWSIQPGAQNAASIRVAEQLEEWLRDSLNFHEFLAHQLTAPYYGYAASEIDWEIWKGRAYPAWFSNVSHQRFTLDPFGELRLVTKAAEDKGVELLPGKWAISKMRHRTLARAGLMRTASWWAVFKRMSVRDWIIFAEKFGIPTVTGYYEQQAGPDAKAALKQAVQDIGEGGYAILAEATRIQVDAAQRTGDASGLHPGVVELCNSEISKLINGATQNVETGTSGSYAQAKVHQARAFGLEMADATRLSHVFRQHVGVPFVEFNGFKGAMAPRLHISVVQEMDPETRVRVASVYCNELGGEIDRSQVLAELGFKLPARPENALRGSKASPAESPGAKPKEGSDAPA
jgi:phage gp29-like protein